MSPDRGATSKCRSRRPQPTRSGAASRARPSRFHAGYAADACRGHVRVHDRQQPGAMLLYPASIRPATPRRHAAPTPRPIGATDVFCSPNAPTITPAPAGAVVPPAVGGRDGVPLQRGCVLPLGLGGRCTGGWPVCRQCGRGAAGSGVCGVGVWVGLWRLPHRSGHLTQPRAHASSNPRTYSSAALNSDHRRSGNAAI
jgi:hypothetical protein